MLLPVNNYAAFIAAFFYAFFTSKIRCSITAKFGLNISLSAAND